MTKAREIAELGQKLTVDGSGNIDIAGNITSDGLTVEGNVGIGAGSISTTYSPKLHVQSDNSDGKGGILVTNYRPSIIFEDISGGTPAGLKIEADAGAWKFLADTNQDGTFNATRMVIDSSGRVGIGRSEPNCTLGILGPNLSSTSGSFATVFDAATVDGNVSSLRISNYRYATGSDHTTGETRLQRRVDSTDFGFIGFRSTQHAIRLSTGYNRQMATFGESSIVFNEDSNDMDFRVETDTATHALYVDASANQVQVNVPLVMSTYTGYNSDPNRVIEIGSSNATSVDNNRYSKYTLKVSGNAAGHDFNIFGSQHTSGEAFNDRSLFKIAGYNGTVVINEDGLADADFRVESGSKGSMFFVDAGNNTVNVNNSGAYDNNTFFVNQTADDHGFALGYTGRGQSRVELQMSGVGNEGATFYHNNNTDRKQMFHMSRTNSVFNEDGQNTDFRVETVANAHGFFVDAGESAVSINTSSTTAQLNMYCMNSGEHIRNVGLDAHSSYYFGSNSTASAKTVTVILEAASLKGAMFDMHLTGHYWNNGGQTYHRHTRFYLMRESTNAVRHNTRQDMFLGGSSTGAIGVPVASFANGVWTITYTVGQGYVHNATYHFQGPGTYRIFSISHA